MPRLSPEPSKAKTIKRVYSRFHRGLMQAKKLFINLSFSLLVVFMLLIFFELFLFLFPQYSVNYSYPIGLFQSEKPPLDFSLTPHFKGKLAGPEFNVNVTINSMGLRDSEHTLSSDHFRILTLGDSYTFGHGVREDETFLSIAEQKLGIELINAGVPAYAQDNEIEYYVRRGINYSHAIVLVAFYKNDIDGNIGKNDWRAFSGALIPEKRYNTLPRWELFVYSKVFRSRIARLAQHSLRVIRQSFQSPVEANIYSKSLTKQSDGWKETSQLLSVLKDAASPRKLVLVYIPAPEQINSDIWAQNYHSSLFNRTMPNHLLYEISSDLNITYIDFTREIQQYNITSLYFELDPHFNKNGHRLFGLLLAQQLQNIVGIE